MPGRLTHFLAFSSSSISAHPQLSTSLAHFTNVATSRQHSIPQAAIRPIGTLHITICVMRLADDAKISEALSALREWAQAMDITKEGKGIKVLLEGLATFDGGSRSRVLFIDPKDVDHETGDGTGGASDENSSRLYEVAMSLNTFFDDKGLLVNQKDELKLHLTIVNQTYAGGRGGYRVQGLLEEFKDFVWAKEVVFDRVELYRMGEVNGRYISVGGIDL